MGEIPETEILSVVWRKVGAVLFLAKVSESEDVVEFRWVTQKSIRHDRLSMALHLRKKREAEIVRLFLVPTTFS